MGRSTPTEGLAARRVRALDEVIAILGNNPVCYRHRLPAIFGSVFKVLGVDLDGAFRFIWMACKSSASGCGVLSGHEGPGGDIHEERD